MVNKITLSKYAKHLRYLVEFNTQFWTFAKNAKEITSTFSNLNLLFLQIYNTNGPQKNPLSNG